MVLITLFLSYAKTFEHLIEFVYKKEKGQLKPSRGIPKANVKCAINKVNCVLKKLIFEILLSWTILYILVQYSFLNLLELANIQRQKRNLGERYGWRDS